MNHTEPGAFSKRDAGSPASRNIELPTPGPPPPGADRHALIKALIAILAAQLIYWLIVSPLLGVRASQLDRIAVQGASAATVEGPEWPEKETGFSDVELPWSDCCEAGYRAVRMRFDVDTPEPDGLAIVPIVGSDNFRMWVNGSLLFSDGRMHLPDITYHGNVRAVFRIPESPIRVGTNEVRLLLVRDAGSPDYFVAAPVIGRYPEMRRAYAVRSFLLNEYNTISLSIGATLALLLVIVIWRGEQRGMLVWLLVLLTAWTSRLLYYDWTDPPLGGVPRMALLYAMVNLLPVAWANLANQWGERPMPWVAPATPTTYALLTIWTGLVFQHSWFARIDTVDQLSMLFNLALALLTLALFLRHLPGLFRDRAAEVAVFTLCVSLIGVDAVNSLLGRSGTHAPKVMPLLMIGLVAAFLARNVQLFRSSAQINRMLNLRLREREAELTRTHEQLRQVEREQVLADERHRMMQDMHDGVGGQLAALLSMAQPGHTDPSRVLQAVADGLTDLRLIIDSLNQIDNDLALAMGSLRGRLQPLLDAAGVTLHWRIDSRLSLPGFGPEAVLQVYRFVQEAVSNALRHGRARTLTIALERLPEGIELRIEDDGSGLPPLRDNEAASRSGLGLPAMAERAERLEATLVHEPISSGGTRVALRWREDPSAAIQPTSS